MSEKWIAPDSLSGATITRTIVIPVECLFQVDGALTELGDLDNWQQSGALTVDDLVVAMDDMFDAYTAS